jgi:hypothetical protein
VEGRVRGMFGTSVFLTEGGGGAIHFAGTRTDSLTPQSVVLYETLPLPVLVKKFPTFYET